METLENIIKAIDEKQDAIRKACTEKDDKRRDVFNAREVSVRKIEQLNAIAALERDISMMKLDLNILKHNARCAIMEQKLPIALEVLKKYEGKPYGEKTRDKIHHEVEDRANVLFWVERSPYIQTYRVRAMGGGSPEVYIGTSAEEPLLLNNKIQIYPIDHYTIYYQGDEYIEDSEEHIQKLFAAYEHARQARDEYDKAVSAFNDLTVSGVPYLRSDSNVFYKSMLDFIG